MMRRLVSGLALWAAMSVAALAQDGQVWIQVEMLPTLGRAQLSAEGYSEQLPDVAGFYMGSGWYAVALGPYSPEEAQSVMANLMAEGVIPGDAAFIAAAGIPTVLFGPGGEGAHAAEEWVSLADTEVVARTLTGVAARLCA